MGKPADGKGKRPHDCKGKKRARTGDVASSPPIEWGGEGGNVPMRLKRRLWDFSTPSIAAGATSADQFTPEEPSPAVELRRAELVAQFRQNYGKACHDIMGFEKPPADSVDRWLLEQLAQPRSSREADPLLPKPRIASSSRVLLRELLAEVPLRISKRKVRQGALDELEKYHNNARGWLYRFAVSSPLPEPRRARLAEGAAELDKWLSQHRSQGFSGPASECSFRKKLDELRAEGGLSEHFSREAEPIALHVVDSVNREAEHVVAELRAFTSLASSSSSSAAPAAGVSLEEPAQGDGRGGKGAGARAPAVLRFGSDTIRVSALHFRKLRALFELHNSADGMSSEEYEAIFRKRLYLLLRRYITFIGLDPSADGTCGGNMHAAAPETVFAWLSEKMGVCCEVFASPLNCYFSTYFSAFPDVDRAFGSLGSFFDAGVLPEGSYEVGPPYTEEVMELTARKLLSQLRSAKHALSFVVFVPDWPGAGALELMDGPDFKAYRQSRHGGAFALAQGREHHYITGVQFFADAGDDASRRYYTVPHGTRIYVLQNSEGAKKWPFTEELERELLQQLRPPS